IPFLNLFHLLPLQVRLKLPRIPVEPVTSAARTGRRATLLRLYLTTSTADLAPTRSAVDHVSRDHPQGIPAYSPHGLINFWLSGKLRSESTCSLGVPIRTFCFMPLRSNQYSFPSPWANVTPTDWLP